MAGHTISAHVNEEIATRVATLAKDEARSPSQVVGLAVDIFANMSPAARRSLIALTGGSGDERQFAFKFIGRAAIRARERALIARNARTYAAVSNQDLDSEEGIEAEAVMASRL